MTETPHGWRAVFGLPVAVSVLLAAVLVALYLARPALLEVLDDSLTDGIVAAAGEPADTGSVAVVDIDDRALAARGQWPWPRHLVARLLDRVAASGAKSIALDFVLAEPDRTSVTAVQEALSRDFGVHLDVGALPADVLDNDAALARTLSRGPFVLAYEFLSGAVPASAAPCQLRPLSILTRATPDGRPSVALPSAHGGLCSLDQFARAVTWSGFLNGELDPDGRLRRLPLLLRFGTGVYPNLALAALMQADGGGSPVLDMSGASQAYLVVPGNRIPVDAVGNVRIRFRTGTPPFPRVSAEDLLASEAAASALRGRVVFVGLGASGLATTFQTPSGGRLSAADVHAHLVETMRARAFIQQPAWEAAAAMSAALLLAVAVGAAVAVLPLSIVAPACMAGLAVLWGAAALLFRSRGLLVSPLLPGAVVIVNAVALVVLTHWSRQRAARRGMEQAVSRLRASEREVTSILNTIPDIVFRLDTAGRLTFISPAIARYGRTPEALIGTPMIDLVVPEDRQQAAHRVDERRTGPRATHDVEVRLLLTEGGHEAGERWFSVSAEGIYASDAPGAASFVGTQGIARDVEERRRLEAQLAQSKRMEAMGTLAAGVAHDLNNILGPLVGYPELLLMDLPPESSLRPSLESIRQSGQRAAAIVQDMLTIARRGTRVHEVTDVNEAVLSYLSSPEFLELKKRHPQVNVSTTLAPDLLPTLGSVVVLSKVVMNMITNSAEAVPAQGTIGLTTDNLRLEADLDGFELVPAGDYVRLAVTDDGVGIAEEHLRRIFEPFFSKKRLGRSGSGLGMAVVWSAVKDHGGFVDVRSREGEGTRFDIYLPITREAPARSATTIVLQDYLGTERLLVVDDLPEQAEIAVRMLGKLGYTVASVSGGLEAIEYLATNPVDLVVLDMVMPEMDGLETLKRIRRMEPQQKAVLASGYSESKRVEEALALGAGACVRKPFTLEAIGLAVRRELDRK